MAKRRAAPRAVSPISLRAIAGVAFECASGKMSATPMYSKNPAKNPRERISQEAAPSK